MSSSRKRTEHIERIRYPNPLPLPPYPPKLLAIPTPASRFADPRNVGPRLAQAHTLPVVVDAEAGMPLNLTDFAQAWYTDQELEADDDVFPRLDPAEVDVDPEDAFLLSDILEKLPSSTSGIARTDGAPGVVDTGNITWLRRTEYLAAEQQKRKKNDLAGRGTGETIDSSREAQLARIRQTFDVANQPIASIRHPTKPGLRAVDAFSLLPDPDTWATRFDVFRFGDIPGRMLDNKPLPDPRLESAILRPHADLVGQPIYSLFLIDAPEAQQEEQEGGDDNDDDDDMFGEDDEKEDEDRPPKKKTKTSFRSREEQIAAEDQESIRLVHSRAQGEQADAEEQDAVEAPFDIVQSDEVPVHLGHVRDYEAHDESERKDQELIVTYVDGPYGSVEGEDANSPRSNGALPPVTRFERKFRQQDEHGGQVNGGLITGTGGKVAYYHPVSLRASLRVRRRRANDPLPPEHWDAIALGKRSLSMYEKVDRLHVRAAVDDMDSTHLPERIELPAEEIDEEVETKDAHEGDAVATPRDEVAHQHELQAVNDSEEDEGRTRLKQRDRAIPDDDDEEQQAEEDESRPDNAAEQDDQEEDESEEGSGSDDGSAQSDEDMEEDELAALQAEAGQDAVDEADEDGGRRRSRRAAATGTTAEIVAREPRVPLSMDVDEED